MFIGTELLRVTNNNSLISLIGKEVTITYRWLQPQSKVEPLLLCNLILNGEIHVMNQAFFKEI